MTHVRKTYDLAAEDYLNLHAAADGHCMACCQKRSYELPVDHDHNIERLFPDKGTSYSVRGLLCKRCNAVLRKVGDSASVLENLANYLRNWPSFPSGLHVHGTTEDRHVAT